MQIVIELREEIIKSIKNTDKAIYPFLFDVAVAIQRGTPLPKNHGDLIDRNELLDCSYEIDSFYCLYDLVVSVDDVKDAPTIIEAEVKADERE